MTIDSPYFDIQEFVCQHVYDKYGLFAWNFFDPRLIITLNTIRDRIGKPIYVNNWQIHGDKSQRGLRCPQCEIVKGYFEKGVLYMSGHPLGKAADFEVQGLIGQEVRDWIIKNKNWWPYPIRIEKDTSWVHLDVFDNDKDLKVYEFYKS